MPAATVVIPTRNRPDLLAVTLRSVVAQRGVEHRVIVVDDSSSDEIRARVDALARPKVEVLRLPEVKGAAAARNAALAEVGTEWVAFCDDDDLWSPDKLALQLAALEQLPAARWAFTGNVGFDERFRIIDHGRGIVDQSLYQRLLAQNIIPAGGSGVIADTGLVRALGGFRPEVRYGEDWEMWIRLARSAPAVAVDRPLVAYRLWVGAVSSIVDVDESHRYIDEAHAADRARFGIRLDRTGIELRRAIEDAATARRFSSAHRFARLAAMQRNPKKLALAAMALARPRWTYELVSRRSAAEVPDSWLQEVREWLPDLLGVPPSAVVRA